MEVAIAGASGFLGRHLCRHLRAAGHRSVALLRRPRPCPADRAVVADFGGDPLALVDAIAGVDALVNLVGIKRGSAADFRAAHVEAPAALATAAMAAEIGRLIHISVAGCPSAEDPADGPYLATKAAGERLLGQLPLPVTILRPGVIYGDGDDLLGNLAAMIRHAPLFLAPGAGRAPIQPVAVDDVCAAIVAALERPPPEAEARGFFEIAGDARPTVEALADRGHSAAIYDVVGPERMSVGELASRVAAALGLRLWIVPAPLWWLRPAAALLERLSTNPVITRSQLGLLSAGVVGDPEPARRDLGLTPRALDAAAIRERCADVGPWLGISLRPIGCFDREAVDEARGALPRALVLAPIAVGVPLVAGVVIDDLWRSMPLAYVALVPAALALVRPPLRPSLRPSPRALVVGAIAAAVLYGLGAAVLLGLDAAAPAVASQLATLELVAAGPLGAATLGILLWTIVGEELVWRTAVLLPLASRLGPWPAVVVAALLYALAHASAGPPLLAIAAAGAGIFWGWLRLRSGSLAATILCHLLWDLLVIAVAPYGALL